MTALDRRALLATTAASIAAPTVLGAKECPTASMDMDYNVARGPQSRIQQCRACGPRERAQENRRLGRSFEDAARAAPNAPRLGLWKRRTQQVGPISCE